MQESLPSVSLNIVSFNASLNLLIKLSKSGPYGISFGNLFGGSKKVTFRMQASLTLGRCFVLSIMFWDHFSAAFLSPLLLI
jgi:hypothetical protein